MIDNTLGVYCLICSGFDLDSQLGLLLLIHLLAGLSEFNFQILKGNSVPNLEQDWLETSLSFLDQISLDLSLELTVKLSLIIKQLTDYWAHRLSHKNNVLKCLFSQRSFYSTSPGVWSRFPGTTHHSLLLA